MNDEPQFQKKKRVDGYPIIRSNWEPSFQRKKRSESASPVRQAMEPELQRKKKPIEYKKTEPIVQELSYHRNRQSDDYVLLGDNSKFNNNIKYRIRSTSEHSAERGHRGPDEDDRGHQRPRKHDQGHHKHGEDVKGHKRSLEDDREHRKLAEDGRGHRGPAEDGRGHRGPADDGRGHRGPAEDGRGHRGPAEDGRGHKRPAEEASHIHHNHRGHGDQPEKSLHIHHHHDHHRNHGSTHVTQSNQRQSRSRERDPPPKVVVDTGKIIRVEKRSDATKERPLEANRAAWERRDDDHRKGILRKTAATQSTPRLFNEHKLEVENARHEGGAKFSSGATKEHKNVNGILKTNTNHREERPPKKSESEKVERPATSSKLDDRERQSHHAIKYRVGIAPHLSTGPARSSEYMREFRWRDPTKASPLINAETMVYKSHPDLTLFRSSSMAEDSEYRAQFKAWRPSGENKKPSEEKIHDATIPEKPKIQRSKSMKELRTQQTKPIALTPATPMAATTDDIERHEPHEHEETRHLAGKKYRSEYSRNFVPPWNYLYEDGAWKKVHSKTQVDLKTHSETEVTPSSSSAGWYAEVLELRRFADEYRKRAHGTHFSREHLVQLYAKSAELWDTVSSSGVSSERSAVDQERSEINTSQQKKSTVQATKKFGPQPTPLLAAENELTARSGSITPVGSISSPSEEKENGHRRENRYHVPRKQQRFVQTAPAVQRRFQTISDDDEYIVSINDNHGDNFDTDSLDSAGHYYAVKSKVNKKVKPKVVVQKPTSSFHEKTLKQSTSNSSKIKLGSINHPQPTIMSHGLRTQDSHVLADANNRDDIFSKDKGVQIYEDDLISLSSARSLASSTSLASEVLERARSRRDGFWN